MPEDIPWQEYLVQESMSHFKTLSVMKKSYIFTTIVFISILLSSCNSFLEQEPYGQPNSLKDVTDEKALQAVYALYDWQYREGTTGRGTMWYENCSDNFITGRSQSEAQKIKDFTDNGSHSRDVRDSWPRMYQTINYANNIIREIPHANRMTTKGRNLVLGHAHFFRAFSYLWLSPWYGDNGPNGGIPIVGENLPVEEMDLVRPKSVLQNYDQIIADFKKAAGLLPYFEEIPKNQWGLMHKTAAWALIARAALYASQYDSKYYDVVIEYADSVINSGRHELLPNYADVFEIENNWSKEYLMSITSTQIDGCKLPGVIFQNGGFGLYNTWGYFQPTLELLNAFEKGDSRRKVSLVIPGDTIQFIGKKIVWAVNPSSVSSPSAMTIGKYLAPFRKEDCVGNTVNSDSDNGTTQLNIPMVRYADVLLMKAEALIWKNGEGNTEAKKLLNTIRKRAGLPEDSQATKAQLKNERRCEFVLEIGVYRHLDLVRWGDAKDAYSKALHGYKVTLKEEGEGKEKKTVIDKLDVVEVWEKRTFDPNINHVFPIPAREIAKGVNLKQNKGY